MRTTRGLWMRLVDPDHLARSLALTVRGKRRRADVAWFLFRAEQELAGLRSALLAGRWRPDGFDLLFTREPKPRVIARASVADRVVHMALTTLLDPVFSPSLLPENMACRPGRGTHRAVLALQRSMRLFPYAVHLDVRGFFPSVDLDILRGLLSERIRDPAFLDVVGSVLDAGAGIADAPGVRTFLGLPADWPPPGGGLPVGTYTSQFLATHVYLGGLDHHVKRALHVPGYLRYVDDLFLFGRRRAELRAWRAGIGRWLWEERRLRLKHPEARVLSCAGHLDGLGYRITREDVRPARRQLRRFAARVRTEIDRPEGHGRRRHRSDRRFTISQLAPRPVSCSVAG